jgi:transcriptional regulator GlxA family with amidase domain
MDVDVVVYDGFDELDAIGPYEVFANAGRAGADCTVRLVSPEPTRLVTASHGLRIEPDGVLSTSNETARDDRSDTPGVVVVPGGGWTGESDTGARREADHGPIPDRIARLHDAGTTVAGVCTGGMLLARAGLLSGRPAVTHGVAIEDLRAAGATVVDARVVDDGDVVTAGGVTAGLDLAVHLVERLFGAAIAETVTTEMEYEPRGPVYRDGLEG